MTEIETSYEMSETPPPKSVTPVTTPNIDQPRSTSPPSHSPNQHTQQTNVSTKEQQQPQQGQSSTLSSTPSNQPNSSQQFCLRWNNYQTNLTSVFDQLLQNESFVDVTLACDGHSIKAHKMVLSACSPYFQSLFFDNPCQHPIIIMRDVKWPELKAAVEFMYKGEINVSQDQIGPLLRVAEMLKIRGLADVNGSDQELVTPHQSTVIPQLASVAKKQRLTAKDWDSVSGSNMDVTPSTRHRKRRWPSTENSSTAGSPPVIPSTTPDNMDAQSPIPPNSISSMSHPPSTPTPIPPFPIPTSIDGMGLSSLGMTHTDDMEIKPGIAEMIREEERAKLMENSHAWLGASTSASIAGKSDSYQYQLQSMWQKCWNTNQNLIHHLRFRERGPLKSWRPETMAEAIFSVLKDGLSLSQAARKYDIPYPTFVLYANRVHNMLGPSIDGGTDLRPKGRGRPQRILLGIWPDEHIKGVIKTVVFRDAKEFKEDGMHLNYGRHSPVYPFPTDGQLGFPGSQCTNGPNSQTPVSGTESLSPEAAAAVAAVVGLRQQMQMAAAAHHTENFNLPAHCANIHSNNGGSAGSMPMPKLGSPAASGQMGGNNGGSGVQIPRLASPAIPGLSNSIPHSLAGIPGLHIMQSMMSGQPSQSGITISPAHHGGSNTNSLHSSSMNQGHSNSHGHHTTSTTTLNSGSLNISRITSPANSAHDLRMTGSDDENQMHSPLDIDLESGVNLAVSGMAYKSSRSYSSPRPEHIFADELNDFVNTPRSCPSRLSGFKEPAGGIKLEPMTECRGE